MVPCLKTRSLTTCSPMALFRWEMISCFMRESCCIQADPFTLRVSTPSRMDAGDAFDAIWAPTASSHTCQTLISRSRFCTGLPEKADSRRSEIGIGRFILGRFSAAISVQPFSCPAAYQLPEHGAGNGERDDFPAVSGFDSEVYNERDADMDIEVPGKTEFLDTLPHIAERDVYCNCSQNQPDKD